MPETFRVGQGQSFSVDVNVATSEGTMPDGEVSLDVPSGWTVSEPQYLTHVSTKTRKLTFTVKAAADADLKETRIGS